VAGAPPPTPHQGDDLKNVPKLLDTLRARFDIANDSELARRLKVHPSQISRLRAGHPLAAPTILSIHENLGVPVAEIRQLAK
jgi:plasmid maintenance system antidote protein VapI